MSAQVKEFWTVLFNNMDRKHMGYQIPKTTCLEHADILKTQFLAKAISE